ncbi:MAG: hypothetical protein IT486_13410 [Gammaproteobacteria bacterium]|nr:hypothetical protein [Gammaproteobacteria bacterium]
MLQRLTALLALASFTVVSIGGCSLGAARSEAINIIPSHPGAEVYVDGNLIGKGTQTPTLSRGQAHSVMVKCGDSAGTGMIDRKISGTGIADIVGGLIILLPFFGLMSDGAYDLVPNTLTVAVPNSSGCAQ